MAERTIPDEEAIVAEILRRKGRQRKRVPAEKMQIFKAKLGEEIQRTGGLRQEVVDALLKQLKNGDL